MAELFSPRARRLRRLSWLSFVFLGSFANAYTCHLDDTAGNALTGAVQTSDGSIVCTYTSGICSYNPVTGALNTSASTSPSCASLIPIYSTPASSSPSTTPSSSTLSSTSPSSMPTSSTSPSPSSTTTSNPPTSTPATPQLAAQPPSSSSGPANSAVPLSSSSSSSSSTTVSAFLDTTGPTIVSVTTSITSTITAGTPSPQPHPHSDVARTAAIAVAASVGSIGILVGAVFLVLWCRRRRRKNDNLNKDLIPNQFMDVEAKPRTKEMMAFPPREKRPTPPNADLGEGAVRDGALRLRVQRVEEQLEALLTEGMPTSAMDSPPPDYTISYNLK
ncbi:hypothetical protein MSAN_01306300 [Mycena sanguinolenta]|uniref:Uncharacterized protein n=1 Tax=Mycena sanguinolenta TaxID=230812 RepID=A0A8H6YDF1_9AGAR|nr:hypothetical protein MSAN_01306300 [Mycena sanguinolenta]